MKAVVFLFAVVFVCLSPAFSQLAAEEPAAMEVMLNTALMPVMNELRVVKEELASVKADVAAVKADVASVKADIAAVKAELAGVKADVASVKAELAALKREVFDLKLEVRELKGEVRGQEIRITDLREQVSRQANTLPWVAGSLVMVLLAFLGWGFAKWLKDKEKSSEEVAGLQQQLQAQQAELTAMQAELVRLRTENERLKP